MSSCSSTGISTGSSADVPPMRSFARDGEDSGDEGGVCVRLESGEEFRSEGEEDPRASNSKQDRAPLEGVSVLLGSERAFRLSGLDRFEDADVRGRNDSGVCRSGWDCADVKCPSLWSCLDRTSFLPPSFLFFKHPSSLALILPAFLTNSSPLRFPPISRSTCALETLANF